MARYVVGCVSELCFREYQQAASCEHSPSRILIQYYNMLCSPPRGDPVVEGALRAILARSIQDLGYGLPRTYTPGKRANSPCRVRLTFLEGILVGSLAAVAGRDQMRA